MEVETENTEKVESFIVKATDVPSEFFEARDNAKRYFRRFGKVKLVTFRPKRNTLLIEYANEDGMLNALEVAGEYNGHVFNVTRDTETVVKKKRPKKNPDPDWTDDPEIKAELVAMGGFAPRTYDLRPEAMAVDVPETQVPKLKRQRWKGASPKPQKKKGSLSSEQCDLINLIRQQATTVEDKFRILDARDKLIRIKIKKNIELSKASITVGTCPDMCPEKERLMRETQHQVALYEQDVGGKGMNPRLAVKQYSRSSADQEAPLPQELRPVSVLQMTMGYLMHRIMGLCDTTDVNLAEWYHFLWDRTRGIRKDITQQELCCQGAVELVEQCARFHIFCSARLVAEDPSVFDQKINTENLTKCLQTLKYMYHDLALKGEECRNEAEFRAYIILLNLNDGNFMWEVQQLKEHIQQSQEVRFALQVYSSLDKQNYVKFFKLVNSTTFLNACILMRYFIQVRLWAIKTFLKSYSPRISQTSLPVSYLTKILAFENQDSSIEFFETYGLFTNVDRTRIVLDKSNFGAPEFPYVLDRAINLVESKRNFSVGRIVCGRELPPKLFENHEPQNSFDQNGYLDFDLELDEVDSGKKQEIRIEEKMEQVVETPPPRIFSPKTVQSSQSQTIFSQSKPSVAIFGQKTNENSIFGGKSAQKNIFTNVNTTPKSIFGGEITQLAPPVVVPEVPKISLEEIERKRLEGEEEAKRKIEQETKRRKEQELERLRLEEEKRKEEERHRKLLEDQEKKRRLEEVRKFEEMKRQMEQEAKRKQERRKYIEIKATVSNVISEILDTVEEKIKCETLVEIRRKIRDRKLQNVITKWREYSRRKRKRKALDFNPMWFGGRSITEEVRELRTDSQNLVLTNNNKRYKWGKPFDIPIKDDDVGKIDLSELTYKLLTKKYWDVEMKFHNELFWKVIVSLPNDLTHVEKVLDSCINWQQRDNSSVLIQQSKSVPTVTYCIEKQKGLAVNTRNDTNGFIFIANCFNDDIWRRIIANFKNYGVFVKVPVVLILQNYDEAKPSLKTLIQEGIISDYLILVDKFTARNLVNLVEEALIFLSTRVEKAPPLEMDTLQSFLTKFLITDLWKRCNSFAKWNSNYKNCLKNPNTVIYLHNEALDRIKTILLDEECREYPKFPRIFRELLRSEIPDSLPCDYKYFPSFWDTDTYLEYLRSVLGTFRLPNFLENWPPCNQLQLELSVSKYCAQVVKDPQKLFYKVMSVILRYFDPCSDFKEIANVVWCDVIEVVVLEKLSQTDFTLYGTGFVNKSVYNQLIVVYDVGKLDYVKSDWFYINNPIVKQKIFEFLQQKDETVKTKIDVTDLDIDAIFTKITQPQKQNVTKIKSELSTCKKLLTDLEESVLIHKEILKKSGNILKSIMEEK
ncbi:protein xmas-2 isoform X2 [Tribolium madens]|uniref:protein xmas-2 isoform X2 n=1 Tax=Tribolium madens TaxID=41895 RepID=UPI001CF754DC|nr:protein xmas-2 isoform X2 [Tribolium madens]